MPTDYPEARALALGAILPSGTDRYVALFHGDPIDGGVELTLTDYVRVAHQDWQTVDGGGSSTRSNIGAITWPVINEAGNADYWAIYDTAVGGTLLRSGPLLDGVGQPVTIVIGVGDNPEFDHGDLTIDATEV